MPETPRQRRTAASGMTLREWYAGQTLPAILAIYRHAGDDRIAEYAVKLADALIAALDNLNDLDGRNNA